MDVDNTAHAEPEFKPDFTNVSDDEQEPDEQMRLLPQDLTNFWLTSLPAQIVEAWQEISEPNVKLGKIRVYEMPDGTQHVRLFWQPSPDAEMIEYDLETQQSHLKNYIVVTSRAKTSKPDERAQITEMKGAIEHLLECQPRFDVDYQAHLKVRHDAAQPQGGIKFMEDMGATTSEIRRLNAGRATKAAPGTGIGKPLKQTKQPFERMARMAKNDLLDELFAHFRQKKHWSIKELRSKVQQPEVYLREVLNEIAVLERSGPNNGMYRLTENYAPTMVEDDEEDMEDLVEMKPEIQQQQLQQQQQQQQYSQMYKLEPAPHVPFDYGAPDLENDDEDDDDDDDDDMEDVLQ